MCVAFCAQSISVGTRHDPCLSDSSIIRIIWQIGYRSNSQLYPPFNISSKCNCSVEGIKSSREGKERLRQNQHLRLLLESLRGEESRIMQIAISFVCDSDIQMNLACLLPQGLDLAGEGSDKRLPNQLVSPIVTNFSFRFCCNMSSLPTTPISLRSSSTTGTKMMAF